MLSKSKIKIYFHKRPVKTTETGIFSFLENFNFISNQI
jgi:hypothetical protein